jgi:hypothetical protein
VSVADLANLIRDLAAARRTPISVVCLRAMLDPTTLHKAINRGSHLRPATLRKLARELNHPFLDLLITQEDITDAELHEHREWDAAGRR